MIDIRNDYTISSLGQMIDPVIELSGKKIDSINRDFDTAKGAPVFTV